MSNHPSPVLLIIFNKEDETKKVFYKIRQYKPQRMFIAADGARLEVEGEKEKCNKIRSWLLSNIDWECEVKTLFRSVNLGCGRGPAEAITWFFSHVSEGIILEDDCLPHSSFFQFCEVLLEKYRNVPGISAISGNNFQPIYSTKSEADYYFSIFPSSWGWATWRRVWVDFDFSISTWPTVNKRNFLTFLFRESAYQKWWEQQFDFMYSTKPEDMWDFQFHYLSMLNKQLAVIPKVNLVSNIGHGVDGTHFHDSSSNLSNIPSHKIHFPLNHPAEIKRNYEADIIVQNLIFGRVEAVSNFKRLKKLIKILISYK